MSLALVFGVAGIVLGMVALPRDVLAKVGWRGAAAAACGGLAASVGAGAIAGGTADAAHASAMAGLLALIAAADFATRRIPNRAIVIGLAAALPASGWGPAHGPIGAVVGMAVGLVFGVAAFIAGRGTAFGAGDAKLCALIGAIVGIRRLLPALLYGTLAGGVVAAGLILAGRRGATFAYGPYLALGTVAALLVALPR